MKAHTPLLLALALAACGGPSPAPTPSTAALEPVLAETVEDTATPVADVVQLAEPLMADAVPIATESVAPEPVEPEPVVAWFKLRHGETLDHFARWSELPVEDIAAVSGLDLDGDYPVGTELAVPVSGEDLAALQIRREEHEQRRVEGYLASRGGSVGTDFYTVRTGDTAWYVSREVYGMPMWVLASYNPAVSLDHLRPGQELLVPVLADTVVDAGPTED